MNSNSICGAAAVTIAIGVALAACGGGDAIAQTPSFNLTSPDIIGSNLPNKFVLNGFGCSGGNVSPALQWANAPAGTKSFALQVYDPDAPTGSGLWHWAVYDIPAGASVLAQGAGNDPSKLPAGAYGGSNDFQNTGVNGANGNYGGPCPPAGDAPHHYVFTLYALGVDHVAAAAQLPQAGTPALYGFILRKGLGAALLGTASMTVTYGR